MVIAGLHLLASVMTLHSATQVAQWNPAPSDDLPLVEVPAAAPGGTLALMISGDGGWAGADQRLATALASGGVSVVGLNAPVWLATRRTPEQAADEVARTVRRYLERWRLERLALVGYSRGADLVPLIANRLPADLRRRLDLVGMLGLGYHAGFHVGLFDVLHSTTRPSDPPTLPELELLHQAGVPLFCAYGTEEKESLCRDATAGLMTTIAQPGGHRVNGDRAVQAAGEILRLLSMGNEARGS